MHKAFGIVARSIKNSHDFLILSKRVNVIHQYQDLINIFNACFASSYNTRLIKGEAEPLYLPANSDQSYHAIYFAHGFFSSALHECAHWFIAGKMRRNYEDYGYWYIPDGRNVEQQALFQQVEVKPQAIELLLSCAANYRFHFSIDNLSGAPGDSAMFKKAVLDQAMRYHQEGLPKRAALFCKRICQFYRQADNFQLNLSQLRCE